MPEGENRIKAYVLAEFVLPDDEKELRLDDERALVLTTDFFTPIVDDPTAGGLLLDAAGPGRAGRRTAGAGAAGQGDR
jgi:selenophosphate synthase